MLRAQGNNQDHVKLEALSLSTLTLPPWSERGRSGGPQVQPGLPGLPPTRGGGVGGSLRGQGHRDRSAGAPGRPREEAGAQAPAAYPSPSSWHRAGSRWSPPGRPRCPAGRGRCSWQACPRARSQRHRRAARERRAASRTRDPCRQSREEAGATESRGEPGETAATAAARALKSAEGPETRPGGGGASGGAKGRARESLRPSGGARGAWVTRGPPARGFGCPRTALRGRESHRRSVGAQDALLRSWRGNGGRQTENKKEK